MWPRPRLITLLSIGGSVHQLHKYSIQYSTCAYEPEMQEHTENCMTKWRCFCIITCQRVNPLTGSIMFFQSPSSKKWKDQFWGVPSWVVLFAEHPDCRLGWPSFSFSDSVFFSVGGRPVTLGDTLPLLGDSGLSSEQKKKITRKKNQRFYWHTENAAFLINFFYITYDDKMTISRAEYQHLVTRTLSVPVLLLLPVVFGFWAMLGRAARAGFAPCGNGGLGLTGPPGELEEDVALRRGPGSGLVSTRGKVFSGEPGSGLLMEPLGDRLSGAAGKALAAKKQN